MLSVKLKTFSFVVFVLLSLFIAVLPAYQMQEVEPLPGQQALSDAELRGRGGEDAAHCPSLRLKWL